MMWSKFNCIFFFSIIACHVNCFSQMMVVPILKDQNSTAQFSSRTADLNPITLPFWDDFSDAATEYPDANRWLYAKSAWVNTGMGINPPSLKVVTLDGLDSLGKPYNVNDILAKGFADKMISQPMRLDLVDASLRSTVYLSFFYQFQGNGEPPDAGDLLSLSFKNQSGVWEKVWSIENDGTLNKNTFVQILIPINADRFFHNSFQFRFQNFSRLSGPYDTWNLDYIYINNGKSQYNPVRADFPDRTIILPLTSLFKNYRAVPLKHFLSQPSLNLSRPKFTVSNRRKDQATTGNGQGTNYYSRAIIFSKSLGISIVQKLDTAVQIGNALVYNEIRIDSLKTVPDLSSFSSETDSINIKINFFFNSGDNNPKILLQQGDFDTIVYKGIDFRKNDFVSSQNILSNFYSYDDGSAEYGAGLNQPGAQFAYQFDMTTTQPDTLVAIDVYFPRFGDESSQSIQLHIWKDLEGTNGTVLHQQSITITRSSQNKFTRIPLLNFIGVKDRFFIGWKQSSAAVIAVGLDKSSDSGSKIFFNTNSAWEQNLNVAGSLMMRPVFGKGKGVITAQSDEPGIIPYPNPTRGAFNLPKEAHDVMVYDMRGAQAAIDIATDSQSKLVTLQNPWQGIYLVRFRLGHQQYASRIMVQEP